MTARAAVALSSPPAADPRYAAVLDIGEFAEQFEVLLDRTQLAVRHRGAHAASSLLDANRQAVEGLARRRLAVPTEAQFILRSARLRFLEDLPLADEAQDEPLRVSVPRASVRRRSAGGCYAISGDTICLINEHRVAWGGGAGLFVSPTTFEDLRTGDDRRYWGFPTGECQPADPEALGLDNDGIVLIGEVAISAHNATGRLVPTNDTPHFDRPLDHYPGLMLADGARQLALLTASSRLGSPVSDLVCTSEAHEFLSFAELTTPPTLAAETLASSLGSIRMRVMTSQHQFVRASSLFTIERRKASPDA